MLKSINEVRLVWMDETTGQSMMGIINEWRHDSAYAEFFRENPTGESLASHVQRMIGKTFIVYHDKVGPRPLGILMFFNMKEFSRNVEAAILIDQMFQAKGLARNALIIACDYFFNTLNLYKVCIKVMERNDRLNRSLKNFGAQLEGRSIRHQFLDGEFHDINNWALFKSRFNKAYENILNQEPGDSPVIENGADPNGQISTRAVQTVSGAPIRPPAGRALGSSPGQQPSE